MATSSSTKGLSSRVKGTWRTLTKKDPTHCLVCWPEEEDSLSIVQMKKIVSPRSDSLVPDTFCKVKGLEQFQCKVVALGSESEMKSVMTDMEMPVVEEKDGDGDEPPPNKKARTEPAKKTSKGKANRAEKDGDADEPPPKRKARTEAAKKNSKGKGSTQKKGSIIIVSGAHKPNEQLSDVSEKVATSKSTSPSLAEQSNPVTTLEFIQHEGQLSLEQPQTSRVIADNPSSDSKSSPQIQPQDEGEEKEEDDRSKDNSVDAELLLNMMVDDNCNRLDYLEAELIKLQKADADKSRRLQELEATVARLEASFGPPAIPPKGLPPSPQLNVDHTVARQDCGQPASPPVSGLSPVQSNSESSPPPLPPPLPPLNPKLLPTCSSKTPQQPNHPPPNLAHTPAAPNHPPPSLPNTPRAPTHPPRNLELSSTPPLPRHPPPRIPLRETQEHTGTTLPSSAIPKSSLLPVSTVVHTNADLVGKDGKMTTLAVALAREAFFGEEVMARCTAKGYGGKPGLPHKEMMLLKEEVRRLYPNYWNSPHVFEEKWNKCSEQISQACNRIRAKRKKKTLNTE